MRIEEIYKRNHTKRPFEIQKITDAVLKAMISIKVGTLEDAEIIAEKVKNKLLPEVNILSRNVQKLCGTFVELGHDYQILLAEETSLLV